ncbi:MAG: ABC transporter substrate-binding protein [Verrucomicrobia bacterium]|nr:MAG: ABC transporter substrate-binding protein [Verrucomicrobiota bacterium]
MGKRTFPLAVVILLLALSFPARAQQPNKVPRIGFVTGSGDPNKPGALVEAFQQGLRDLGYVEGKNILVEYRYIEGKRDRISGLVAELVQLKVDVFVSPTQSVILAAKQATRTIPIVMAINGNPVTLGLVDSLARPGGNITGLTSLNRELSGKRLELFNEVVPRISRVGILTDATSTTGSSTGLEEYEAAARAIKMPLQSLKVRGPSPDLEDVFRAAVKARVSALISVRAGVLLPYTKTIADLAIKNRLPLMFEGSGLVESYSPNDTEFHRRAATYVDKILKGAKPADLPVEQPMKFEFVINLKTAKQIGLTIPQTVLYRADRVIK